MQTSYVSMLGCGEVNPESFPFISDDYNEGLAQLHLRLVR